MTLSDLITHLSESEHLFYFFAGVILAGLAAGVAGYLHSRMVMDSINKIVVALSKEDKK